MRSLTSALAALLAVLFVAFTAAPAAADWPGKPGRYVFEVTRNGDSIGTQTVTVKPDGDAVVTTTESVIAVKMLGIVVYRLHQTFTETYQGRKLISIRAESKDGDGLRIADVKRDGDHWSGTYQKETRSFDCDCETSSMWQMDGVRPGPMIEASLGRLRNVKVTDRGNETLDLPEGPVTTRHLSVTGDIERDVWYDPNGNLVSATQKGSDGSDIRQTLMSDPAGSRDAKPEASE